jgi:hypothetical protein
MNTRKRKCEVRPGGDERRQIRSSDVRRRMSAVAGRRLEDASAVVEGAMARRSTSSRPGVAGPTMTETG